MVYKLSCTLVGHSKDVRAVASGIADGQIITGSRDCTAKLWKARADGETGYEEVNSLSGHSKYVSVVTMYPPSDDYPEGLILTGSHDGIIRAYRPEGSTPEFTLEGHSQTVSSLYVGKFHTLVSGSWDTTAKVWNEKKQIMTLSGHQAAVWAVAILPQVGIMLTGSADKTIKLWKAGACQNTLTGHTDCIRDLAVLSVNEFLSCANDCVVKRWNAEGQCTATYHGHENYIYSLALMPNGVDFVTSGEDRTVRVWTNGEVSQTIRIPAQSVWCVTVLPSGDIAAGASDGKVWLFSQNASRQAPEELQAVYEDELSKQQLAAKTELGGVKMSDIPGPESLLEPGRRDGQTKMVRDGNSVSVHSWSAQDQKWTKIGDVVGAPEQNKKLFEGKEYDYVFDIDIDEPKMVLKLPYNTVDDPWMVAQKFIHKHDLSQYFLEQIANFIIQNTNGEKLGTGSSGMGVDPLTGGGAYVAESVGAGATNGGAFADPFTGSGAYVSGSGGVEPSRKPLTGAPDPLTGSGAYTTGEPNGTVPMDVDNTFFPQTTFLGFNQKPNPTAMVNKLKQFNATVDKEFQIPSDDLLERLPNLGLPEADSTSADVANLIKVLGWPLDKTFPALDILRLAVKNPKANDTLLNAELIDNLVSLLLTSIDPVAPDACQMLALRTMANMFTVEAGKNVLLQQRDPIITRLAHMLPRENKNVQVAMSTVMINFAVALSSHSDPLEGQVQCVSVISLLFLEGITDPEAKFRTLVALGTLLQGSPENIEYARSMEAVPRLKSWKLTAADTPKVVQCADFILQML